MSAAHVTPTPAKVASIVDSCGLHFARERWGWLDVSTLTRLAATGRPPRTEPRAKPVYGSAYSVFRDWDGTAPDTLTRTAAASALGLTESTLTHGNA